MQTLRYQQHKNTNNHKFNRIDALIPPHLSTQHSPVIPSAPPHSVTAVLQNCIQRCSTAVLEGSAGYKQLYSTGYCVLPAVN